MSTTPEPTARKGKIARLPAAVREEVCRRLHDGEPGSKILAWLNALPEVQTVLDEHFGEEPVTPQNLSEWRKGGYQEWLRKREKVESLRVMSDYALRLAKAADGNLSEGAAAIAGGKILELLEAADEEDVHKLAASLSALRGSEARMVTARINQARLSQKEREIALEEQKFRRQTCELFLKWFEREEARRIAQGAATRELKVQQLIPLFFGEKPEAGDGA
jgi:hypothetical protein